MNMEKRRLAICFSIYIEIMTKIMTNRIQFMNKRVQTCPGQPSPL